MTGRNRKGLTRKQLALRRVEAKRLRDALVPVIERWSKELVGQPGASTMLPEHIEAIRNAVLEDAYAGLIWRSLAPTERYNTPYHQEQLGRLRAEHPDLKVGNKLNAFVSWPVFRKEDIEAAFSDDVEPLFREEPREPEQ